MENDTVVALRQPEEFDDLLTDVLRQGARKLLAQAVEAEKRFQPCSGKKELIGFQAGFRESAQSWSELLADLKSRGLSVAPELAIGDGALGFWKALEQEFGTKRIRSADTKDVGSKG